MHRGSLFKPIRWDSDSDSDIEWLPDLPDDGVSLPASHRRSSYKPRKSTNNNNKRKSVVAVDCSSDDENTCACSISTGNTKLMCTNCRVAPVPKKPKFVDLTSPVKPMKELAIDDVITIDCSPQKDPLTDDTRGERHYLDTFSPNSASKVRDYSISGRSCTNSRKFPTIDLCPSSNQTKNSTEEKCVVVQSGTRLVKAATRNRTNSDVVMSGDGRNISWNKCPRLPCLVSTSHPSVNNPKNKEEERTVFPFDTTKLYTLQACQPDSGEATRKQKLDLVKMTRDFCNRKEEPPSELITSLFNLLRDAEDDKLAIKIHRCLLEMMEINPPKQSGNSKLPFDWSMLVNIMDKLNLNMAVFDQFRATTPATTVANTLALDYIVSHLESELVHRPMGQRQITNKSAAAVFLNDRLRSVIKYLQKAIISYNEYDQLLIERLSLTRSDSTYRLPLTDIEKIVPLLQRLLDLFLVISKEPRETVDEIVTPLREVYLLCCLKKRQLLLKTVVSPFVKLKLVHIILMDTTGAFGDHVPSSFHTMHDILMFFRNVKPFCIGAADTPPTSPSPHEENSSGHSDNTEEIAMLLYTAVTAYIEVVKGNFRTTSHLRFLEADRADKAHNLSIDDVKDLRNLDLKIEELRSCLQAMVGPGMALSHRTTAYLDSMYCIQDVFRNEVHDEDEVIIL